MPVPLQTDPSALGLAPRTIATSAGPLLVHAGRPAGGPAGGPATILLHGAAGSWTTWTPLLTAAGRAGTPITDVLAIDLPGWGGSPGPVPSPDTVSRAVTDVADAAGYSAWRLVGHSLGGFAALDLAARRPDATLGVGLVSPTGPAVVGALRSPITGGARLPWFAGMLLAMRALALLPDEGRILLRGLARVGALGPLASPLFAARPHPTVVDALADEVRPLAFVAATRAAASYDLGTWRRIRCPVRSVRGARDVFTGPRDDAALTGLLADFSESVLPDAGHFAAVEQPDAVLAALRDVLHP